MRKNSLRELLRAGSPTVGTRLFLCDPTVVETVGHTSAFDYVELLGEYVAYDLRGLEEFCRAAELHSLGTMIKVDFESRAFVAHRSVGAGFEAVLFADSRSAADVRSCVRALRPDTPDHNGLYGAGPRRRARPTYGGGEVDVDAAADVVVAVMIEKGPAVESLDEILEVRGVDLVQWGPGDYAMSIGLAGQVTHPCIRETERRVIAACHAARVPCRAEIATVEDAKYYADLGVRHFSLGSDLWILHDVLKDGGERLRAAVAAL